MKPITTHPTLQALLPNWLCPFCQVPLTAANDPVFLFNCLNCPQKLSVALDHNRIQMCILHICLSDDLRLIFYFGPDISIIYQGNERTSYSIPDGLELSVEYLNSFANLVWAFS